MPEDGVELDILFFTDLTDPEGYDVKVGKLTITLELDEDAFDKMATDGKWTEGGANITRAVLKSVAEMVAYEVEKNHNSPNNSLSLRRRG